MNIPRYRSRGELSISKEERHTWQKVAMDGDEVSRKDKMDKSFEFNFSSLSLFLVEDDRVRLLPLLAGDQGHLQRDHGLFHFP